MNLLNETWSAPKPLKRIETSLPRLVPELIPTPLRAWIWDSAERIGVPPEYVAVPALVSVGALIGLKVGIFPKKMDSWWVSPVLWGAIIGSPSKKKTAALNEGVSFVRQLEKSSHQKFRQEVAAAEIKRTSLESKLAVLKKELRDAHQRDSGIDSEAIEQEAAEIKQKLNSLQVIEQRFITSDATTEKLCALLAENHNGLLLIRDELAGWFRQLERFGREGDREFFLECWSCTPSYRKDRVSSGAIYVPNLCLSIVGGIQPGKLNSFIAEATSNGHGADGMLQRIQLMVNPNRADFDLSKAVDRKPDLDALAKARETFESLAKLNPALFQASSRTKDGRRGLSFDCKAQGLFSQWLVDLETELASDQLEDYFESHLAKYRSLVPALALIFHVLEEVGKKSPEKAVKLASVESAIEWSKILRCHAEKTYWQATDRSMEAACALLGKIKAGIVCSGTQVREIYRMGWTNLRSSDDVYEAINVLKDYGYLRVVSSNTVNNKESLSIQVNPIVLAEVKRGQAESLEATV